jgi:hypothetical protein
MRNRTLSVVLATMVALAAVIVPAGVAGAVVPTVTLTIQLTDPSGAPLTTIDEDAVVRLKAEAGDYDQFRAATDAAYPYDSSYAGTITAGVATFTGVPAAKKYLVYVNAGVDYSDFQVKFTTKSVNYTKSIALAQLGTISGTLTGPGGAPIADAVVQAAGFGEHYTTTDENGDYTIHGLYSHLYKVEFNTHWQVGGGYALSNTANSSYTWSYWPSAATAAKAQWIRVAQQSATKPTPTAKVGIDGTVAASHTVTFNINVPGAVGSAYGYRVSFIHKNSGVPERVIDSSAASVTVPLNAGSYIVSLVIYDSVQRKISSAWFHGDGRVGVIHAHASTLTFTGTEDVTYSFGQAPA